MEITPSTDQTSSRMTHYGVFLSMTALAAGRAFAAKSRPAMTKAAVKELIAKATTARIPAPRD